MESCITQLQPLASDLENELLLLAFNFSNFFQLSAFNFFSPKNNRHSAFGFQLFKTFTILNISELLKLEMAILSLFFNSQKQKKAEKNKASAFNFSLEVYGFQLFQHKIDRNLALSFQLAFQFYVQFSGELLEVTTLWNFCGEMKSVVRAPD